MNVTVENQEHEHEHSDHEQEHTDHEQEQDIPPPLDNQLEKLKKPRKKRQGLSDKQKESLRIGRERAKFNQQSRMLVERSNRLIAEGIIEEIDIEPPPVLEIDEAQDYVTPVVVSKPKPKPKPKPKAKKPKKPKKKKIVYFEETDSDTSSEEEIVYKKREKQRVKKPTNPSTPPPVQQPPVMIFR